MELNDLHPLVTPRHNKIEWRERCIESHKTYQPEVRNIIKQQHILFFIAKSIQPYQHKEACCLCCPSLLP